MTVVIVTVVTVKGVIVTVVIVTVGTVVIATVVKQLDTLTTDEMFDWQRFAILAMCMV